MKRIAKPIHPYQDIKTIQGVNQCLSWWLVHSFLYYRFNNPIISDSDFDKLTSWVKMSWSQIDHVHKHLVTIDDLNANSGYAIQYPLRVEFSAMHVLREIQNDSSRQIVETKPVIKPLPKSTKTNSTYQEYDSLFS